MKIKTRLVLMMLTLGIVFSLIPSIIVLNAFLDSWQNDKIDELKEMVNDIKRDLLEWYKERYADISIITSPTHFLSTDGSLQDKISFLRLLEEKTSVYSEMAIYDVTGVKLASTRSVGIGKNYSNEQFFAAAINGNRYFSKIPQYSDELSSNVIYFSGPLYNKDGKIVGAVSASVPSIKLNDITVAEIRTRPMTLNIVSSSGDIIYSNRQVLLNNDITTPIITSNKNDNHLNKISLDGKEVLLAWSSLKDNDIDLEGNVLITIPTELAFSEIHSFINLIIIGIVGMFIASFIAILYFSKTLSTPIEKLTKHVKDLTEGKLKPYKIEKSYDEVDDLGKSFNHMTDTLLKTQKRNFELRKAMDESAIIAITDKKGTITFANDKFCEISKYTEYELIGQNHRILKSGYHPDSFYQNLWKTISSGHIWQGDIKNKAKDGSFYWVRTTIVPFLDSHGVPEEYIAIRIDVTANYNILQQSKENEFIAKRQLQNMVELDRQKNEFASMISHELKTPLVPIKGYAEMLQDPNLLGKDLTSSQYEAVDEILQSAKRLEKLISDVLEIQRLEMNQLKFTFEKIHVGSLQRDLERTFLPFCLEKNIQIKIELKSDATIISDKGRIMEVFTNLVQNAVDFVPDGTGNITISAVDFGQYVAFSVADNGPGIPNDKKEFIFKKFYQTDTSTARKHGGTGLGLHICKGIVEKLNGKIWFESSASGTIFYFALPKDNKLTD